MELDYERMSHLIAIANVEPGSLRINQELQLKSEEILDKSIAISYSNYVKSHLHLYLTNMPNRKSFLKYTYAMNYLLGDITYKADAVELLRCFYSDVATFLLHTGVNLDIKINADIDLSDVWYGDIGKTKQGVAELIHYGEHPDSQFKAYLDKSKYAWIFDIIDNIEEGRQCLDNFALAASLFEMLQDDKTYRYVEVENETGDE